jgi:hypothetical protein
MCPIHSETKKYFEHSTPDRSLLVVGGRGVKLCNGRGTSAQRKAYPLLYQCLYHIPYALKSMKNIIFAGGKLKRYCFN